MWGGHVFPRDDDLITPPRTVDEINRVVLALDSLTWEEYAVGPGRLLREAVGDDLPREPSGRTGGTGRFFDGLCHVSQPTSRCLVDGGAGTWSSGSDRLESDRGRGGVAFYWSASLEVVHEHRCRLLITIYCPRERYGLSNHPLSSPGF